MNRRSTTNPPIYPNPAPRLVPSKKSWINRECGDFSSLIVSNDLGFSQWAPSEGTVRHQLIEGDSWVHVFTEGTFAGRGRRLRPGQREVIRKIGSIIVGPGAIAKVVNDDGREIMVLPPRQIVPDFLKLALKKNVSHIRVMEA